MAKKFRVGILGYQNNGLMSFFRDKYGVEVFDLTADQICSLLENPDTVGSVQASRTDFPTPVINYKVMEGGRLYPGLSREKLFQAVKDIDILISRLNTKNPGWNVYGHDFFRAIFTESCAPRCKMMIARVVGKERAHTTGAVPTSRTVVGTEELIRNELGLDVNQFNFKGTFYIVTDKSRTETEADDVEKKLTNEVSISRVRSELTGEELKTAIMQPVKETVAASKAIIGLGERLGQWFSSLVH